jgi:glucose/mannose-6-phosphate isomerase
VDVTSAVGYRLKCQFNENSKLHAFHNVIPELNHNEIIGWESFLEKQFNAKLILILDKIYHPQIKKRFEITSSLISGDKIILDSSETDFKLRIMDLIYLGDWITYYLALLREYDPTEIENINILKEKLA